MQLLCNSFLLIYFLHEVISITTEPHKYFKKIIVFLYIFLCCICILCSSQMLNCNIKAEQERKLDISENAHLNECRCCFMNALWFWVSFVQKTSHSADVKTREKPLIYIQAVRESQFVCMSAFTLTSEQCMKSKCKFCALQWQTVGRNYSFWSPALTTLYKQSKVLD